MKTLYLVRHAKSSWKFPELDDFERPLNKRGKRDAPAMGRLLKDKDIMPDIIISSPAVRASMTTKIISDILSYTLSRVKYSDEIYEADTTSLLKVVSRVDDKFNSTMLIGHNPGMTYFANMLANARIDNIPTCGIFCTELDISSWQEISENCGTFKFFKSPKNL
ncbi:MAG: histidine phosphatase family protein [Calditrichia bacterium]|nr:histidine phosphatase family protein [Calditrichia bacterium]